jgi:hypothetical protein
MTKHVNVVRGKNSVKTGKDLNDFIDKYPHLIPFQKKIDAMLRYTPENQRLEVLNELIIENLEQLKIEFIKIHELSVDLINKTKNL